jgi:tetratricopeptide (TPR) repeat protein
LAHNNLGILLIQKEQLSEGIQHLREALRLKPGNAETEFNLALALNQQQQWNESAAWFDKTIGLHADDANAHFQFATALAHLKKTRQAMSEFASALLIQQDFPDALDGLAWILSTDPDPDFRNGTQAIRMAERACYLTQNQNPQKLKTLAAAYAETGSFAEATNTLRTAEIVAAKTSPQLTNECSLMMERFQHSERWRGR